MAARAKVALVLDALPSRGGAERMLEAALELFPEAPVYSLIYHKAGFQGSIIARHPVHTSFINRLPGGTRRYRSLLPLLPLAIEQFDLREYDILLTFSYAVAHGVLAQPEQRHISFFHTPLRYAWHQYHAAQAYGMGRGALAWPYRVILHYFRLWDSAAAQRVDTLVGISDWVRRLIWRAYRREAQVVYPPVDVERFQPLHPREGYYMALSRLMRHKRVDLIVEAFSQSGLPLVVVGEGPEYARLRRMAAPNVRLVGWQSDEAIQQLLGRAKAFVHAAEEEFGMAMVEAQAAGSPVIAFGRGGAAEIVQDGQTGLLYREQTVEALREAVERFEAKGVAGTLLDLRCSAERFRKERFQEAVLELVG